MAEPAPGRVRKRAGRANTNGPAPWGFPGAGPPTFGDALPCTPDSVPGRTSCWPTGWRPGASAANRTWRPSSTAWRKTCSNCRQQLTTRTYRPGSYVNFYIHEPKRRKISAAPFRDRVVHHALCNLIEPVFERTFVDDSFANRLGKGTHRALSRVQKLARRFPYVLQGDLRQFFPSVDHAILRPLLARKIHDPDVIGLTNIILASGEGILHEAYDMVYFPGDDLFAVNRPRGLPIGNLTSQFWANVYLNPFDHFVKRELGCRGYVRYVYDFLMFAEDKTTLWRWRKAVVGRLARLRLTIHRGTHPRPVGEGIPFWGLLSFHGAVG